MTSLSHIDLHYPHFLTYTSIFLQKLSVFQGRPDWSPTSLIRLHPRKHLSLLCNIWNRLQVPLPNLLPLCCWTDRIFVEWGKENKKTTTWSSYGTMPRHRLLRLDAQNFGKTENAYSLDFKSHLLHEDRVLSTLKKYTFPRQHGGKSLLP